MSSPSGKPAWATALRLLAQVDWPKVLHQGAVFVRELRGDRDVESESARAQHSARAVRNNFESMGRHAVGCLKPAPCSCPFCLEEREQR